MSVPALVVRPLSHSRCRSRLHAISTNNTPNQAYSGGIAGGDWTRNPKVVSSNTGVEGSLEQKEVWVLSPFKPSDSQVRAETCNRDHKDPGVVNVDGLIFFFFEIFNENQKSSNFFCHFTYESSFNLVVLSCHSMKIDVSATKGQRDFRPGKSGCVCRTYKLDYRKHLKL